MLSIEIMLMRKQKQVVVVVRQIGVGYSGGDKEGKKVTSNL
jgi:hypothetical protein